MGLPTAAGGLGSSVMKSVMRAVVLCLCALIGLWALVRGISSVTFLRTQGSQEDFFQHLIEASVFIAGGICVLSVAVEQLYCWRTHHKDDSLL
jgi:hypothetical protein